MQKSARLALTVHSERFIRGGRVGPRFFRQRSPITTPEARASRHQSARADRLALATSFGARSKRSRGFARDVARSRGRSGPNRRRRGWRVKSRGRRESPFPEDMSAASASASSPARPLANASRPRVDSRMMSVRPSPRAGWFGRVSRAFARVPRPGRLARVPPNVAAFARADDHEASARRDAAATTGRLAPLDVTTMVGAELELIMKVDPNAFERTLADKVRRASSNPHRSRHRPCTPATAARGNILYPPTFRRRRRTTVNHPRLPARFSPAATRPRPSLPRHSPPPLPLAPDPPAASQLRDHTAEVLHPTFPGGRSGTLRPNAPEHRAGRDGHHDRDDRHHDDDDDAKRAENEMGEGRVRREDRREDEALRRHVP